MRQSWQQFVQRDGKVAYPPAGRVVDRVGDGCRGAGDAHLADAEQAERHVRVRVVQPAHIERWDVGVHRHWAVGAPRWRPRGQAGLAAARSMGVPSTLRMTWMLPRVALEYGQRQSARAMRSAASAGERCGACRSRATCRPKPPWPVRPMPTREWIWESLASSFRPCATPSNADWKQAA